MIQTTDLRGLAPTHAQLLDLVPRSHADVGAATDAARRLVDDVRERGAAALRDQIDELKGQLKAAQAAKTTKKITRR